MSTLRCKMIPFLLGLLIVVTATGCSSLRGNSSGFPTDAEWAWKGEEEWLNQKLSIVCDDKNALYIIGSLLSEASSRGVERLPKMAFTIRDDRASKEPENSEWSNEQMIRYYHGVRDDPERSPWDYELAGKLPPFSMTFRKKMFGEILRLICVTTDYNTCMISSERTLLLAPREMLDSHYVYQRRVYQLPREREWFKPETFPGRLPSCGIGCAFDRKNGLLVIIGGFLHLNHFEYVLDAIGAEEVYSSAPPAEVM